MNKAMDIVSSNQLFSKSTNGEQNFEFLNRPKNQNDDQKIWS